MINVDDRLLDKVDENEFWMLIHICKFVRNSNMSAFPSMKTIRKRTGFGRDKAIEVKKSLVKKKCLVVKKRYAPSGRRTSDLYTITCKELGVFMGFSGVELEEESAEKPCTENQGLVSSTENQGLVSSTENQGDYEYINNEYINNEKVTEEMSNIPAVDKRESESRSDSVTPDYKKSNLEKSKKEKPHWYDKTPLTEKGKERLIKIFDERIEKESGEDQKRLDVMKKKALSYFNGNRAEEDRNFKRYVNNSIDSYLSRSVSLSEDVENDLDKFFDEMLD